MSRAKITSNPVVNNPSDLESALNEAVAIYAKRIEADPSLKQKHSELLLSKNTPLEGRNMFDVHINLIKQMRSAYERSDKAELERTPLYWGNYQGCNSVTYFMSIQPFPENCNVPYIFAVFDNETSGQNVKWIRNYFRNLDFLNQTRYFKVLFGKLTDFEEHRNRVGVEIYCAVGKIIEKQLEASELPDQSHLRSLYRDEEFKRVDEVIALCKKAEHVYQLASDLVEKLRLLIME